VAIGTIITTLREDPEALKMYGGNISEVERKLAGIHIERISVEELETINRKSEISRVLAHLPAEAIIRHFGQDILLWTWLMYPERGKIKDQLRRGVEEITGVDMELLERAQIFEMLVSREDAYHHIMVNYNLLQAQRNGNIGKENLEKILFNARKRGDERVNEQTVKKYSITITEPCVKRNHGWDINWKKRRFGNKMYEIYLDAAFGFLLLYNDEPSAVCTFDTTSKKTALIKQFQGTTPKIVDGNKTKGNAWALAPFDWTRFFVDYTSAWLQQFGFEDIGIQAGQKNRWIHKRGSHQLPIEMAEARYDGTAQRLGFRQHDDGNWYRRIA
jgi:hypothetical protein